MLFLFGKEKGEATPSPKLKRLQKEREALSTDSAKLKKKLAELQDKLKKINFELQMITNQMRNIFAHISTLGIAFDLGLIPKIHETEIRKAQKAGMKFIKDTVKRTAACEKKHPKVLEHNLKAFYLPDLMELGFYEIYHEFIIRSKIRSL